MILLEDGQLLGFGYAKSLAMKSEHFGSAVLQPSLLMKDNTIKTIFCGGNFALVQTMNGEVFHFKGESEQCSIVKKILVMKNTSIKFIQQRNFIDEWKPENHQICSQPIQGNCFELAFVSQNSKNQSSKVCIVHHCETNLREFLLNQSSSFSVLIFFFFWKEVFGKKNKK